MIDDDKIVDIDAFRREKDDNSKVKLTFNFNKGGEERLDYLAELIDADTYEDVVFYALKMYDKFLHLNQQQAEMIERILYGGKK